MLMKCLQVSKNPKWTHHERQCWRDNQATLQALSLEYLAISLNLCTRQGIHLAIVYLSTSRRDAWLQVGHQYTAAVLRETLLTSSDHAVWP